MQITCKNCGRPADSTAFILDPIFGKLVCQQCVKDRKSGKKPQAGIQIGPVVKTQQAQQPQQPQKAHPAGWDAEDELLERAGPKIDNRVTAPKLDENHIQIICSKCAYKIKYDINKQQPRACPYCSMDIDLSRMRF